MERPNVRKLAAYFVAFLSGDVATQIESIAVAWSIFTLHHHPFDLGLIGLTLGACRIIPAARSKPWYAPTGS
jgi:hypothetical protein